MKKVVIGIATTGYIRQETVMSLFMALPKVEMAKKLVIKDGCYVHWNRNAIVKNFLTSGADTLFFLDSDMVFPKESLSLLLSYNKDIMGAAYNKRKDPPETTARKLVDGLLIPEETLVTKGFPFMTDIVATGFMAIQRRVLETMPEPWFSFSKNAWGKEFGEDESFCLKARELNYEVWAHPGLYVGHVGVRVY